MGPQGSTLDCWDLSPLLNTKLAEPENTKLAESDFRGLATFIEAKRTFGPSWRRGTAQQASPRESGDKSHAVHGLRHPLLSFQPKGSFSCFAVTARRERGTRTRIGNLTTPAMRHSNLSGIGSTARPGGSTPTPSPPNGRTLEIPAALAVSRYSMASA